MHSPSIQQSGFTTIWNYITLKPIKFPATGSIGFYHYLELHHSQTRTGLLLPILLFYHYLELHHSQTANEASDVFSMFYHYLELHHSQT